MASTLRSTGIAVRNLDFIERVRAAVYGKADAVLQAAQKPYDGNAEALYAQTFVRIPDQDVTRFLWAVASNAAIAASVNPETGVVEAPDADIIYVVDTAWSHIIATS